MRACVYGAIAGIAALLSAGCRSVPYARVLEYGGAADLDPGLVAPVSVEAGAMVRGCRVDLGRAALALGAVVTYAGERCNVRLEGIRESAQ